MPPERKGPKSAPKSSYNWRTPYQRAKERARSEFVFQTPQQRPHECRREYMGTPPPSGLLDLETSQPELLKEEILARKLSLAPQGKSARTEPIIRKKDANAPTASAGTLNESRTNFIDLPREVRDQIYGYVLEDSDPPPLRLRGQAQIGYFFKRATSKAEFEGREAWIKLYSELQTSLQNARRSSSPFILFNVIINRLRLQRQKAAELGGAEVYPGLQLFLHFKNGPLFNVPGIGEEALDYFYSHHQFALDNESYTTGVDTSILARGILARAKNISIRVPYRYLEFYTTSLAPRTDLQVVRFDIYLSDVEIERGKLPRAFVKMLSSVSVSIKVEIQLYQIGSNHERMVQEELQELVQSMTRYT